MNATSGSTNAIVCDRPVSFIKTYTRVIWEVTNMGTILLVDDNPLRASMRCSSLEGTAPPVVRVSEAAEALCLIEDPSFANRLVLVLTIHFGAATSSISSVEFVSELRTRMPHLPVLVLGAPQDQETQYQGMAGVYLTQSRAPQELRAIVNHLVSLDQRQYA